jgi:phosphatidylinositol glycan class A protein
MSSFVDIIYLGRIMPKAAAIVCPLDRMTVLLKTNPQMAKKSIRLIPGLGWFMLMSGAVFIDRSNNKSAIASMAQAGEDMKRSNVRYLSHMARTQAAADR